MSTFNSIGLHPLLQKRLADHNHQYSSSSKKQKEQLQEVEESWENNNNHHHRQQQQLPTTNVDDDNNTNSHNAFPPIHTPQALLTRDAKHISDFLSLPLPMVYQFRSSVANAIIDNKNKNAWEVLEISHQRSLQELSSLCYNFSTGSNALDKLIGGGSDGIPIGKVVQVTGPSPSGKTQLALSIAAHCCSNNTKDFMVHFWTSSTSPIPLARRLQSICYHHQRQQQQQQQQQNNNNNNNINNTMLDQVQFKSIQDGYHLYISLQKLFDETSNKHNSNQNTNHLNNRQQHLLILDSASSCLSNHQTMGGRKKTSRLTTTTTSQQQDFNHDDIIYSNCLAIRKLANRNHVTVFITNGTVQSGDKPALHNTLWRPADVYLTMNILPPPSIKNNMNGNNVIRKIQVHPQYPSSQQNKNNTTTTSVTVGLDSSGIVDIINNNNNNP